MVFGYLSLQSLMKPKCFLRLMFHQDRKSVPFATLRSILIAQRVLVPFHTPPSTCSIPGQNPLWPSNSPLDLNTKSNNFSHLHQKCNQNEKRKRGIRRWSSTFSMIAQSGLIWTIPFLNHIFILIVFKCTSSASCTFAQSLGFLIAVKEREKGRPNPQSWEDGQRKEERMRTRAWIMELQRVSKEEDSLLSLCSYYCSDIFALKQHQINETCLFSLTLLFLTTQINSEMNKGERNLAQDYQYRNPFHRC